MKNNYFFKRTLSVVVLLMASSLMWASDFVVDGIYYNVHEDGKSVEVAQNDDWSNPSYNPYPGDIVIPSSVAYEGKTYSVTSIGNNAFLNSYDLTSVEIPNSVTSIGNKAFWGCISLTSIEIPNSVTSIGNEAFSMCSSLTSIEIPNSMTSIGKNVFTGCSSLTSVVIPNSVTSIGDWAFAYCSSLTSVICYAEDVPELDESVFFDVLQSKATLYVPASAIEAYKAADQWKEFGTILPIEDANGITSTTAEQEGDATYYTLDGVNVKNPTKKGIYIQNGKKVFINK